MVQVDDWIVVQVNDLLAHLDDLVLVGLEIDREVDEIFSSDDFNVSLGEIPNFFEEQENENTRIKTEHDVKPFAAYLKSIGEIMNMELIPYSMN
ncbi:hypothetical protein CHS0354_032507 [Potamilus streckersoni]|uniref:Uncharacterized protein n=1 Tax=Potamilus streckersoni TaxID=2493646 RepID=A0AAE0SQ54_9BIVA|nr:hypothetical protein CHS0354_032507 [Potamilus streckersoni]